MDVEARLLAIGGEEARQEIQRLKLMGLKTEPAFARYLNLKNDPYVELLRLAKLSQEELQVTVNCLGFMDEVG